MKNVQIIEPGHNCEYSIFAFTDEEFAKIFPNGQDVEFIEDVIERLGEDMRIPAEWRPIDKKTVQGIHGTLFYQLIEKKKYYPSKLEAELQEATRALMRSGKW